METSMLCLQTDLGVKASALKHYESEVKFGVKMNDASSYELHRVLERAATMRYTRCC